MLAVGIAAACGSEDRTIAPPTEEGAKPGVVAPPSGQGGRTSRPPVGAEAGEGSDVTEPGAPEIEITSPEALDDPADGAVIVGTEIDVVCRVEKSTIGGAMPVDKSSVVIDLLDAEGKLVESMSAEPTDVPDEFSAHLFVTGIDENGPVSLRCSARDTSLPAKLASRTIGTFLDKGPTIQVVEPEEDSAHALRGAVRFEFDVTPAPLADRDPGAEVDEVTLLVKEIPIPVTTDDGETYQAFVDFTDRDLFTDIPNGEVPVTILARNSRSPEAGLHRRDYSFVIDGQGPIVSIASPKNEQVVGGQVRVQFSVEDALSGVDPDTLVLELNDKEYNYGEGGTWARMGTTGYVFLFDSVQAEKDSKIQATITIRATDEVGNMAEGESLILYLDNVPPEVDLDPGPVIETQPSSDPDNPYCSFPFDPVGPLSANDLETIEDVHRFRALVSDLTNEAPGQNIRYYAGQRLDSVYIYLQADVSKPLLIDEDGDGYCDELIETRNDLPFQHLNGIASAGSSWFGPASAEGAPELPERCQYQNAQAPAQLCSPFGNDMTRVVKWDVDSKIPMIFGIGNLGRGPACTGTDWEIGQFVQEGWFCVAGRAEDNVGNVGISPPLRLCYDDGDGEAECDESAVPECTDGCIPPPRSQAIRYMRP